jgi:thiazole synthase
MAMEIDLSIAVRVNGEQRLVPAGVSIAAMLCELGIDPKRVAVERNLEIVPRAMLGEVTVADGDAFEIVHFVGGG